jgi:hypothetical protein
MSFSRPILCAGAVLTEQARSNVTYEGLPVGKLSPLPLSLSFTDDRLSGTQKQFQRQRSQSRRERSASAGTQSCNHPSLGFL